LKAISFKGIHSFQKKKAEEWKFPFADEKKDPWI
jgi:hypothetical protein